MIDARMALLAALAALSTASPALAESAYPTPTRDGQMRIQRTGTCPTGYVGKGHSARRSTRTRRKPSR